MPSILPSFISHDLPYDNSTSGLVADNAQDAIDELAAGAGTQTMQDSYEDSSVPQLTITGQPLTIVNDSGDPARSLLRIRNNAQNLMFLEVRNVAAGVFNPSVGFGGDAPSFNNAMNLGGANTWGAEGTRSVTLGAGNTMNGTESIAAVGAIVNGDNNVILGASSVTADRNVLLGGGIISTVDDVAAINTTATTVAIPSDTPAHSSFVLASSQMMIYGINFPGTALTSPNLKTVISTATISPGTYADVINIAVPDNSAYIVEYMCQYAQNSVLGIFSGFEKGTIYGSRDPVNGFFRNRDIIKTNSNTAPGDVTISNPAPTSNNIRLEVTIDAGASAVYEVHVSYNVTIRTYQ